jgi:prepilin-type N-terminal cleavage/methylation domain-containing protein
VTGHRSRWRPDGADHGMALLEVLVAMGLSAVLLTVVMNGVLQYSRSADDHRARTGAVAELQVASQKLTRELRSADRLVAMTTVPCGPSPAGGTCATAVTAEVSRAGQRWRLRYHLVPGTHPVAGELRQTRETWTGTAWSAPVTSTLARGLLNDAAQGTPLFRVSGQGDVPAATAAAAGRVDVLLVRSAGRSGGNRLTVGSSATLRSVLYTGRTAVAST